eukprot:CAMPEP_0173398506 /NCGR_PEP_ID=MMETSP1356-20130122/41829_1 /TAXON_ID=77927 ORGANISM="Hemiselmis virescens, Strain PCC157" /NCGR_SAMPLE_ID=MMETSP1356 /ASSEMBLY_ACC=CAM_ASM_000847 /LENGTH=168 /DNA_ID=CAMNT_0014358001 /DNA_START=17 /DNA_END=520 /DNA_ORIENTATION=-
MTPSVLRGLTVRLTPGQNPASRSVPASISGVTGLFGRHTRVKGSSRWNSSAARVCTAETSASGAYCSRTFLPHGKHSCTVHGPSPPWAWGAHGDPPCGGAVLGEPPASANPPCRALRCSWSALISVPILLLSSSWALTASLRATSLCCRCSSLIPIPGEFCISLHALD